MRDAVGIKSAGAPRHRAADRDVGVERIAGALVHYKERQRSASPMGRTHTKERIVARRADEIVPTSGEVLQQPFNVKRRIGVSRARRVDAINNAIVTILAPSVESWGIVVGGFLAVAQVPPGN